MKNRAQMVKEMKDILTNNTYEKTNKLPNRDNTGYKKYGNNWASVVSIDIRNFKGFSKKFDNEYVVKMIQCFTKFLAEAAKDEQFSEYFRDIYFAGDEVIVVFETSTKKGINKAFDFALFANTISNQILKDTLISEDYDWEIKSGIGMWTSSDNTLAMVGHKYSENDSTTSLIGSSINYATLISKKANKDANLPIIINNTVKINLDEVNSDLFKKYCKFSSVVSNQDTWTCNIWMTM